MHTDHWNVEICIVCGATYETGHILFDKRLRASLERYTITGWGLCTEHQGRFDDGFVALVEYDRQRSAMSLSTDRLKSEQAYRTGKLTLLKSEGRSSPSSRCSSAPSNPAHWWPTSLTERSLFAKFLTAHYSTHSRRCSN